MPAPPFIVLAPTPLSIVFAAALPVMTFVEGVARQRELLDVGPERVADPGVLLTSLGGH